MKPKFHRHILPSAAFLALAPVVPFGTVRADDDFWSATGTASWTDDSQWSLGFAPTADDRAIINGGGQATVADGDTIAIQTLRFVRGSLAMTGGSISGSSASDFLRIGDYAFNATSGTATLAMSGSSAITGASRLYIADGNGAGSTVSTANVTLSGTASITNNNDYLIIGRQGGAAAVTLNDSAVIEKKGTTNTFIIGDGNFATGAVTLKDSSALKSANQFLIGNGSGSNGAITLQNSSTLNSTGNVVLGNSSSSSGAVTLSGTSALSTNGEIYVGNASGGTGELTVSGNAIVTKTGTGGYITAARANSTGTITVEDGGQLISQNSIRLAEGGSANGTLFAKDNAVIQAANALQVGHQGTGKLDVSGSAQVSVGGEFGVGTSSGKGTLLMTGGTINATGAGSYVVGGANNAQATVTLSGNSAINGGNMKWKTGDFGGTGNAGSANISLSGSASLTLREFTIGHIGSASATEDVTLSGSSTLTVNDFITIGRDDNNTKSGINSFLNLNGGTLATKYVIKGADDSNSSKNLVRANGGVIKALANESDFFKIGRNDGRVYVTLQSGGLKFDTNGFNIGIQNPLNGSGGLTKQGAGTLTLFGSQPYAGATQVNNGTLRISPNITLNGACNVAPGATFEVSPGGSLGGTCSVAGGGSLAANGNIGGFWQLPALNLADGSSVGVINLDPVAYSGPVVEVTGALTPSGTVTLYITGDIGVGTYPLVGYDSLGGDGFSAFQLGALPRGVTADLVDSGSSVDIDVTSVIPLVWKGGEGPDWDIDTTGNWTLGGSPDTYLEGDNVLFDDSATTTAVSLAETVSPLAVKFDNSSKDYTLEGGANSIAGIGTLYKTGSGVLTLTGAHTYTGITTVDNGTLSFGDGVTSGSITGALVNYADVVFNPAGSSTLSSDIGGPSGTITKIGSGTQILTGGNTYGGDVIIDGGTLQLGDGSVNGTFGNSTFYDVASGAELRLNYASADNTIGWSRISGAGLLSLNSAQPVNASAAWGSLALSPAFTGTLRVEKGRVDCSDSAGAAALGEASKIEILSGAQILCRGNTNPGYGMPIEIAGNGWGEGSGLTGALRMAAGAGTVTWSGPVTLMADSGITVQTSSTFNITGSVTGPHLCEFKALGNASLNVAPDSLVRNSYGSTRIGGETDGSIVAGNAYAFSSGPLEVLNGILKLNGHSFDFASLGGTGGRIGNYHDTAPATLTVGGAADTSYTGGILDGSTASLGLTKTGSGKLTLTGALTYTGNTAVDEGTLSINSAFLDDGSTVSVASGAQLDLNTGAAEDVVAELVLGGVSVPAGTYNSSHATYGSYFTGTGSIVIVGGYDSWATDAGLTGANNGLTDDADNDGTDNLLEFYLNGDPLASDSSILPAQTLDATYLTLTFSRRDDAEADVTSQSLQYGSDLAGWTSVPIGATTSGPDENGVIVTVSENGDAPDTITVQIPRVLDASGKLFARLQVTK